LRHWDNELVGDSVAICAQKGSTVTAVADLAR